MSDSDLFKITESPGKGLGAVALKDIPKRTLILKESPQFVVHNTLDKFRNVNHFVFDVIPKMMSSFNSMAPDDQKEYLSLEASDRKASDDGFFKNRQGVARSKAEIEFKNQLKIYNIYMTNKFGSTGIRGTSGTSGTNRSGLADTEIVCLKVSRFNHSCRSNAFYDIDWNKKDLSMEIKASKDIKAGQEITICYEGGDLSMRKFQIRRGTLKFNCICKVCKNGPAVDKADFDEYDKIMQDSGNLLRGYQQGLLDYQTICMKQVDGQKKAYNLGRKNKASPSFLYRRLSAGFLQAALGFRHFKTSEFKENAVNFVVAAKKLQELFGFVAPETGEWQKRLDFDKWILKKESNKFLDQYYETK